MKREGKSAATNKHPVMDYKYPTQCHFVITS